MFPDRAYSKKTHDRLNADIVRMTSMMAVIVAGSLTLVFLLVRLPPGVAPEVKATRLMISASLALSSLVSFVFARRGRVNLAAQLLGISVFASLMVEPILLQLGVYAPELPLLAGLIMFTGFIISPTAAVPMAALSIVAILLLLIGQTTGALSGPIPTTTPIPMVMAGGEILLFAIIGLLTMHYTKLFRTTISTLEATITECKLAEEALQQEHVKLLETKHELLKAHDSLAEADRLESVGRLAAGVAHEVKNPLTIIRLGVDYLAKQFSQESSREVLDDIGAAIIRADHVIRDLLDFSRQKPFVRRPININQVIDNAIHLVKHETERRNIAIVRNRIDPIPPIYGDPDRLVQVFINLLSNAAQAIGQDGSIEVVTRSILFDERDLERSEGNIFRIGEPIITVDIRDTGPGISTEHERKLFEPFFTTKPVGEGTGLGLAVSRNIIIMHKGSINISNRPEGGASALVMFRVARENLANEKANIDS